MDTVICKDTGEVCTTYSEYLASRHWKSVKQRYTTLWNVAKKVKRQVYRRGV